MNIETPNILGNYLAGKEARREAEKRNFLKENAGALMAGDANAMARFAGYDPEAALGIMQQQQQIAAANQRAKLDRETMNLNRERFTFDREQMLEEGRQKAEALKREQNAAELEQARDLMERGLAAASKARNAAEWDAIAREFGAEDLVGKFDQREAYIAYFTGLGEGLKPQSPQGKLNADVAAGFVTPEQAASSGKSEAEKELERLQSIGIPRDVAIKVREGVYRTTTDPLTRELQVVDLSNGQIVFGKDAAGPQAASSPQAAPTLFPGAAQSFGLGGAARSAANTAADIAGLEVPFRDVQSTVANFGILKESLLSEISNAYSRQPPSWLMKEIADLIPEAGKPLQGSSGAQAKLQALRRHLHTELSVASGTLRNSQLSPTLKQEIEQRVIGLNSALQRLDAALGAFGSGEGQRTTSGGIKWSVVD